MSGQVQLADKRPVAQKHLHARVITDQDLARWRDDDAFGANETSRGDTVKGTDAGRAARWATTCAGNSRGKDEQGGGATNWVAYMDWCSKGTCTNAGVGG